MTHPAVSGGVSSHDPFTPSRLSAGRTTRKTVEYSRWRLGRRSRRPSIRTLAFLARRRPATCPRWKASVSSSGGSPGVAPEKLLTMGNSSHRPRGIVQRVTGSPPVVPARNHMRPAPATCAELAGRVRQRVDGGRLSEGPLPPARRPFAGAPAEGPRRIDRRGSSRRRGPARAEERYDRRGDDDRDRVAQFRPRTVHPKAADPVRSRRDAGIFWPARPRSERP